MNDSQRNADEQKALWNGAAGHSWVEAQEALDRMFQPFEDLLVEAVAAQPRACVLDVGCGTGSTTLAIQRSLGAGSECVGLDISEPMLARARSRAEQDGAQLTFICADAERHVFERSSFDMIVSRFGVMFFTDPVRAFANLRHAARPDAELCCTVWRSLSENPFMTTAERAAAGILPHIPARDADAPGQFAFADPNRVRRILEESGWDAIDILPIDVECSFPEQDLVRYATRLGPLGRVLQTADEQTKARTLAVVREAFEPYVHGPTVRFAAACWRVGARAPR